jgi:hypothetical protein
MWVFYYVWKSHLLRVLSKDVTMSLLGRWCNFPGENTHGDRTRFARTLLAEMQIWWGARCRWLRGSDTTLHERENISQDKESRHVNSNYEMRTCQKQLRRCRWLRFWHYTARMWKIFRKKKNSTMSPTWEISHKTKNLDMSVAITKWEHVRSTEMQMTEVLTLHCTNVKNISKGKEFQHVTNVRNISEGKESRHFSSNHEMRTGQKQPRSGHWDAEMQIWWESGADRWGSDISQDKESRHVNSNHEMRTC